MLNISLFDQDQLFKQTQLKKFEENTYLESTNDENYKYIKDKFFYWEKDEVVKLMNVGSGLFSAVSNVIKSYVASPTIDFDIDMDKYVADYLSLWFATIGLERKDGKLETVYLPAQNYWNDNWVHKILRLYVSDDPSASGQWYTAKYYTLVQEYWVWYIENKLYRLVGTSLTGGTEVPLDTIPQTEGMKKRIDTGIGVPAIFVVKDDEKEQYPTSLFEKIKTLVYAIDRHIVMQHTQYMQHVESFVLLKGIRIPNKLLKDYNGWKKIDFSQLGRVVLADEEWKIEFVNNSNELIDSAMQENTNLIRRISSITSLPIDFLWLDSDDWSIGEGSRTLKHWAFYKMIEWIRAVFDPYIQQISEIIVASDNDIESEEYVRPDVISKSDKEFVEELKIAREEKFISQLEAIKRYNDYDDNEAQEEYDKIQEESQPLDVNNIDNEYNQRNNDGWSEEGQEND